MLFICCFDFEMYYGKLVFHKFTRKPTSFFNYIDFIQKLNLVDLQTQGRSGRLDELAVSAPSGFTALNYP